MFTLGVQPCLLYGEVDDGLPSPLPKLSGCLCLDFPLCSIESECETGVSGTCLALAAFRGVSEDKGILVVTYSLSMVAFEQIQVLSAWSYSYLPCEALWESQRSALAGTGFDAQLFLLEHLALSSFLSHSCKLGIENLAPWSSS